ncbi:hypothetical protein V493_05905 [Pseudogymnoascus sp. VKM F-4281 (FW-2241)]|nr:hypothetical protein V493_05905 [Pseudogymnoascus sp. VKM F-4281 (FW-2241)]
MYGRPLNWVQRVRFGLYIKHGPGKFIPRGEGPALKLVEQYTDVAAPRLIDLLTTTSKTYLVMTRIPGIPLEEAIQRFSYPERSQLAADIRRCVSQFRQIPNPNSAAICSADGGPAFDYRLGDPAGPFDSEEAFNKHIIYRPSLRSAIHDHRHEIFFSHADFSPTNLLVERGRLSGIVDFGCAGFYPESWEYTKGVSGHFGRDTAWPDILSDAFSGLYENELAAEKLLNYTMNGHYSDGGLYIVLSSLGGGHYHHALYIHVSHPYGMLYHLNPATATSPTTLSDLLTEDIPTCRTIIAALLIDPDVRDHNLALAHSILVDTPLPPVSIPTSTPADIASASSSWVISALTCLGSEVFRIDQPVAPLMEEAALLAAFAAANGSRELRLSRALQARIKAAGWGEVNRGDVRLGESAAGRDGGYAGERKGKGGSQRFREFYAALRRVRFWWWDARPSKGLGKKLAKFRKRAIVRCGMRIDGFGELNS